MSINGVIVWEGPSEIDGQPVVLIMTGLESKSANRKTGAMVQTYILRSDIPPVDAYRLGEDVSICGACPHRSLASGGSGGCYVTVFHGPRSVWACFKRGGYPRVSNPEDLLTASGRMLRLGSYGDPGAIPAWVWRKLCGPGTPRTGYTHRWQDTGADLVGLVMASTDTPEETRAAQALGWSTFRVAPHDDPLRLAGEARCPASEEAGRKTTCDACPMACDGMARPGNAGRVIRAHGASKKRVH